MTAGTQAPFDGVAQFTLTEACAIICNWRIENSFFYELVVKVKGNLDALDAGGFALQIKLTDCCN